MREEKTMGEFCPSGLLDRHKVDYDLHPLGGRAVVPYIASWTGERMQTDREVVYRTWGQGIAYADETPADRDEYGVLWMSHTGDLGAGRPLFKKQHPIRQRHAMTDLLCQVCARPADQTEQGVLWLLPATAAQRESRTVLRPAPTTTPPICMPCARISVTVCPALRSGFMLIRAHSRVRGVTGWLYAPGGDKPRISVWDDADQIASPDSPLAPWMLAAQLHRTLYRIHRVNWDEVA